MKIPHKILLIFLMASVFSSCKEYIGGDINQNPNDPITAPLSEHLPAIQIALADICGGEFSRMNSLLVQQVEGLNRTFPLYLYSALIPERFDASWTDVYENILIEIKIAKAVALEEGHHHYRGILYVVEAYTLMMATDVWDDMPYSEALNGINNFNPAYDEQSAIYNNIYALLDEAVDLFNGPAGTLPPENRDVYFFGNINNWIKAAHAIKARGLLHDKDYAGAMAEATKAFEDPSENMGFNYPDPTNASPWFRFNRERADIAFNPQMGDLMLALNDTNRLAVMDQEFFINNTYLQPDFFQELITFRETQFIIAEADVRNNVGGSAVGHAAYLAGIKASFDRLGLSDADYQSYISQPTVDPGVGNLTLELVMTQKYIAMFLQPEAYSDWRRTGVPTLEPEFGSAVPVRWQYPAVEHKFNANAPSESEIDIYTDRVGWNR